MSQSTPGQEPPPDPQQPRWGQGQPPQQPPGQWQQPGGSGGQWQQRPPPPGGQWPPPPPGQWQQPPARKRRTWPWVVLVLVLLVVGGCALLFATVVHESSKTVKVTYEVTGDATGVTISYSTWNNDNLSTSEETARTLPWRKELTTKGFVKGGSLVVTTGEAGGTAKCSVTVDNGTPKTATATGPFAVATCGGF
ncbi:hypothetical protein QMK19_01895 [Streptomyces sp. H10-C2]|uniref:hypothetical protein n=1 Tax=unclassified Streptomyces TaxID=2593676 RepID=UPI0024BB8332|nr:MULTISPECIES: hypothetical protein [unclassified Streptomyces]MDJ0342123.1 hypothetical protein [Streptomyces sp. PH10-H1]MDJ0368465.1 hypothetical protein [Streptomyces sp. H10-C2]